MNDAQFKDVTLNVDQAVILAYAEMTDDFNPIHVDPVFAATTPLGGVIAHGTMSLNLIWQSISATFGEDAIGGALLDVKFVRPVRIGDTVRAGGSAVPAADGRHAVWVKNQDGVEVISGTLDLQGCAKEGGKVSRKG